MIPRALGEPFQILDRGSIVGYGAIWRDHYLDRVFEVVLQESVAMAELTEAMRTTLGAHEWECQTNIPALERTFAQLPGDANIQNHLFAGPVQPAPVSPEIRLIATRDGFDAFHNEVCVGNGGLYYHYNRPFTDVSMHVDEPFRRRGYGSAIVRALANQALANGDRPAARCNAENEASRKCLIRGGFVPVGTISVKAI